MAWTFRAAGTAATGSNAASLAPGAPSGKAVGDLLILEFQCFGGVGARTPTRPTGWTGINNTDGYWSNSTTRHGLWWRIADGTSADTPTLALAGAGAANDTQLARLFAFTGGADQVPVVRTFSGPSTNVSGDSVGAVAGVAPNAGDLLLLTCGKANDWSGTATLSPWLLAAQTESTTGSDAGMALLYQLAASGTATGDLTVADSGGSASTGLGLGMVVVFVEQPVIAATGSEVTAEPPATAAFVGIGIEPASAQATAEGGTPTITTANPVTVTGSDATAESGTAVMRIALAVTGSEATAEGGTPTAAVGVSVVAPTGSEGTAESGAPAVVMLVAVTGSEATAEDPGTGGFVGLGIEAVGSGLFAESGTGTPIDGRTLVSATGSEVTAEDPGVGDFVGVGYVPVGGEVAAESGVPDVLSISTTLTVNATGSEVQAQMPYTATVEWDAAPDGSEATAEGGSPVPAFVLPATGSEATAESTAVVPRFTVPASGSEAMADGGTPFSGTPVPGVTYLPTGSEVTAQSGTVVFTTLVPRPTGTDATAEDGTPVVLFGPVVTGGEATAEGGTPTLGLHEFLQPTGSEVTAEDGQPAAEALVIVAVGSEATAEDGTGTAVWRLVVTGGEVAVEAGSVFTDIEGFVFRFTGTGFKTRLDDRAGPTKSRLHAAAGPTKTRQED
jgi:hypothetical protein